MYEYVVNFKLNLLIKREKPYFIAGFFLDNHRTLVLQ